MANNCITSIVVRGRKECVNVFDKVIHAKYNYNTMEFPDRNHFIGVNDVSDGLYQEYGFMAMQDYVVDCRWSAELCLMNTPGSYYSQRQEIEKRDGIKNYSTNIVDLSRKYGLDIELWSQESGMGFEEHILVEHGEIMENECYDYYNYYIEDYNTYEEFIEDNKPYINEETVTKEMFEYAKDRHEPCIEIEEDFAYTFNINGFETGNKSEMCRIIS